MCPFTVENCETWIYFFSARLQYLQWVGIGDTAVLHYAIEIILFKLNVPIHNRKIVKHANTFFDLLNTYIEHDVQPDVQIGFYHSTCFGI